MVLLPHLITTIAACLFLLGARFTKKTLVLGPNLPDGCCSGGNLFVVFWQTSIDAAVEPG